MQIDDDAQAIRVPSMLLQPLVENAFRHGVGHRTDAGCIEISATANDGVLSLRVSDNGPGIAGHPDLAMGSGFGLSNTVQRLRQLYGTHHRFEIRNKLSTEGGGLEVLIDVPARLGD